jgi:hypothetical protein
MVAEGGGSSSARELREDLAVERDVEEACAQGRVGDLICCLEQLLLGSTQGFGGLGAIEGVQGTILEIPRTDERYALPPSLNDQLEGALRGFEGFVCFFLGKICLGKDSIDTRSHPLVLLAESKRLMETGEGFVKVVSIQESCPKFDKSFPFFSVSADSAGTLQSPPEVLS